MNRRILAPLLLAPALALAHPFYDFPEHCMQAYENPYMWCSSLQSNGCCMLWKNIPAPDPHSHGQTVSVVGHGEHCTYAVANALAKQNTGCPLDDLTVTSAEIGGICTPSCPKEAAERYTSPGCRGKHLGRLDRITVRGTCEVME